ncbi:hypothetical protein V1512DRAFT_268380 [Lipomyces arxii]|uniref:uncharacterized protein n=1 Tax=Lipomyces arxii TaxID=56418 RepID=UPI0034CFBA0A
MATHEELRIAALEAEVQSLSTQLSRAGAENDAAAGQNAGLVKQVDELAQEAETWRKSSDRWRKQYMAELRSGEELKASVGALQQAVSSRDESNRKLAREKVDALAEARLAREDLKRVTEEAEALAIMNGRLEQQLKVLEEREEEYEQEIEFLSRKQDEDDSYTSSTRHRRDSNESNVRTLSDELDLEYDESMKAKVNAVRDGQGWDAMSWLTPDEMASLARSVSEVWGGETDSAGGVLAAALAKQAVLIDKIRAETVKDEYTKRDNGKLEHKVQDPHKDETDNDKTQMAELTKSHVYNNEGDKAITDFYKTLQHHIPFLWAVSYFIPYSTLSQAKHQPTRQKIAILLSYVIILLTTCTFLTGVLLGFYIESGRSAEARAWCAPNQYVVARAAGRIGVPWWVGSRVPMVEKLCYSVTGWISGF